MKKLNIFFSYLCSFIVAILLFLLVIICILKFSVFNKEYLYKELAINNYYDNLEKDINEEIDSYIISSGFKKEITNNLYTKEEMIKDTNLFIDNYYNGKKTIFNKEKMYMSLEMNIRKIEEKDNLQILDSNNLHEFILDIVNIYQNEIRLYGLMDSFIPFFYKVAMLINKAFSVIAVLLLIFMLFIKLFIKKNFLASSIMSVGIILIIMRIFLYERIDIGNILIITNNFSNILNNILVKIGKIVYIISLELLLIGIFLALKSVKQQAR